MREGDNAQPANHRLAARTREAGRALSVVLEPVLLVKVPPSLGAPVTGCLWECGRGPGRMRLRFASGKDCYRKQTFGAEPATRRGGLDLQAVRLRTTQGAFARAATIQIPQGVYGGAA